jgi:CTP synthase (UTP-ammonia lyase)
MSSEIKVGVIGDFNTSSESHRATNDALNHAAGLLSATVNMEWVATPELERTPVGTALGRFHALWCAPGSPYKSMTGALEGIRFARESGRPFLGTLGGFQHTLVEYARNVLGIEGAEHEETSPRAPTLVVSRLACSLVGKTEAVRISPHTIAHRAYGRDETTEQFRCNFGLNQDYLPNFTKGPLEITGVDRAGEVRIVELSGHPFFVATLFLPQLLSRPSAPYPLVLAYLRAASPFRDLGRDAA